MSPILDSIGSVKAFGWGKILSSTAFESIASTTVGAGGASDVTFSSIPSTYTHLQIRTFTRDNGGGTTSALPIQFNSDTGNNYVIRSLVGNGSSLTAYSGAVSNSVDYTYHSSDGANSSIFGTSIIDILDYKNTNKYKTVMILNGVDFNGSGLCSFGSSLWLNTSAITSIKLFCSSSRNLKQYSQIALYGIKGE